MIEDTEVKHIWHNATDSNQSEFNFVWKAGWYFSDEGDQLNGPYETREEAIKNFDDYCEHYL
jgi:hypothetical protein